MDPRPPGPRPADGRWCDTRHPSGCSQAWRRGLSEATGPGRRAGAREARRLAFLALFEDEFRQGSAETALERLLAAGGSGREVAAHAGAIVRGVLAQRAELDGRIASLAPAIPVAELGRVERTILRSAIWEVLYSAATSSGETIRDAVSLARTYAGDAARRLVNGVLGSVSRSSGGGASR